MSAQHTPGPRSLAEIQFEDAVHFARMVRRCRGFARTIRNGCTVYGWTLGEAEREARRAERRVRLIAESIAKATGSTA